MIKRTSPTPAGIERYEFPFHSTFEQTINGQIYVSLLGTPVRENRIDGMNLNQFYNGFPPGRAYSKMSKTIQNDYSSNFPNDNILRKNKKMKDKEKFRVFINIENLKCTSYSLSNLNSKAKSFKKTFVCNVQYIYGNLFTHRILRKNH